MLNVKQSITLNGQSVISGTVAVNLYASIGEDTQDNVTSTIVNKEVFNANKTECRKDMAAFQEKVYEVEDSLTASNSQEVADNETK